MKTFTLKYLSVTFKDETVVNGLEIEKISSEDGMVSYRYTNDDNDIISITFPAANFISLEQVEKKSVSLKEIKKASGKIRKTEQISAQTASEVIEEACQNFNIYEDPHLMFVTCKYLAQQERSGIYTLIRYQLPNFRAQVYARCEGRSVQPRLSEFRTLGKWIEALGLANVDTQLGDSTFRLLHEIYSTPRPIMKHFEQWRPNMVTLVRGYKAESTDSLSRFI